ncbi:MAG: type II toxin-antitoxin system RelE/ParE family toxin [Parvibaculaceae bacterium]
MTEFIRTQAFDDWLARLKGQQARTRIAARIFRFEETGHPGDTKAVGEGVREMRFDFGPGYRVYYIVLRRTVILLGGSKSTQVSDIETAKQFADYWKGQEL